MSVLEETRRRSMSPRSIRSPLRTLGNDGENGSQVTRRMPWPSEMHLKVRNSAEKSLALIRRRSFGLRTTLEFTDLTFLF